MSRILLINENRNGLVARRAVLEQAGYATAIAATAEEGLAAFEGGDYELVVTNYRMSGMGGDELIARIRKVKPQTKIIVISSVVHVLGLDEQNTGADAVIPKSANEVQHLVRTVNRLLRSKTPRKPVVSQQRLAARAAAVQLG